MIAGLISIEDHTIQFDYHREIDEFLIHVQDNMTGKSKRIMVDPQQFAIALALALGGDYENEDLNRILFTWAEPVMTQLEEPELRFIP